MTDLKTRWTAFTAEHPRAYPRDAARALGVSEAELVALGLGETVTRLAPDWPALIHALPGLGRVKTITRNDHAVLERWGVYEAIELGEHMGQVVGDAIDLRFFFRHWASAFALCEPRGQGLRRSLQLFDRQGTAMHKVYLEDAAHIAAFDALCAALRHPEQASPLIAAPEPPAIEPDDASVDLAAFRAAWDGLSHSHEFFGLLRQFGLSRRQGLRLGGAERARPVATGSLASILHAVAGGAHPLLLFVGNPGVLQVYSGPIGRVSQEGLWLNVLDPGFNLHVIEAGIAEAWVVRKPSRNGSVTSLELLDADGAVIALVFEKRGAGQAESEAWRALTAALPDPGSA